MTSFGTDTSASVTIPASFGFVYMCKTAAYTAGTGERALIWSHASCPVPPASGLGVRPAYNVNGGADTTLGIWHYATNTGTATGNVANAQFQFLDLTAGSSYIFSTGLVNSDTSTSYTGSCFCHTMVIISRP